MKTPVSRRSTLRSYVVLCGGCPLQPRIVLAPRFFTAKFTLVAKTMEVFERDFSTHLTHAAHDISLTRMETLRPSSPILYYFKAFTGSCVRERCQ
jgi:hypothetical protein